MGAVREVLGQPDVRRVEAGWGLSSVAELAGSIAVAIYAFDRGGAALVGLYGVARTLPAAAVAPLVMGLADRVRRERLLSLATSARAVLLAAAAVASAAGGPAWLVVLLAAASSTLASTYRPLLIAMLPWLVRTPGELSAANVLATTMENAGALAGPVLAAAVLAVSPSWVAIATAAGLMLVAAGQLWRVTLPVMGSADRARARGGLLREMARGLADLSGVAPPAGMVLLLFAQTFVKGTLGVLIVILAVDVTGAGDAAVGWLYAALGLGGLAGGAVAAAVVRAHRVGRAFVAGLLLWGVPLALLALGPRLAACLAALAVVGAGNALQDVGGGTLTPRLFGPDVLGRVLGAEELVVFAGSAAGAAAAAPITGLIGTRSTLAAIGIGLVALTSAYAFRFVRLDRTSPRTGPRTNLIRALPVFAPLPLASVDLLASRLDAREYPGGVTVMAEGDAGDDYQLIVSGTARVSVRGVTRRELGPGQGFGEIALLREVPRTATVTALEPLHTFALKREDFLAAVTGHPVTARSVDELVQSTLDSDPPVSAGES
jgi:hypothetical protein